jgi:lysyl-tRNA synthetase class 2
MRSTEEMLAEAIKTATGSYRTTFRGKTLDFTPPWDRVRYFDAVRESTGLDLAGADEEKVRGAAQRLGVDLEGKFGYGQIVDEIFAETVEANLIKPTFLTDFPAELSPLAKRHRDDERVVERFEVFAGGMELANAFSEQNDPRAQQEAFERQAELRERGDAEAQMLDRDYIRALEYGMPPTGGVGIGIDRLVMLATGMENIREVILFPQLRPEEGREAASESEDGEPAADASAEGVR